MKTAVVTFIVALMFGVLTPVAGATGGNDTHVEGLLFGCFPGSTVTIVIDGETVTSFPAYLGPEWFWVEIPEGVPGNVLAAVCSGPPERTEAINIKPYTSTCRWKKSHKDKNEKGDYSNKHNYLCLKILKAPGGGGGHNHRHHWASVDASGSDAATFSPVAATIVGSAPLDFRSSVSIESNAAPWRTLQLGGAALLLAACGLFQLQRRRVRA